MSTNSKAIQNLESLLAKGKDSALLRFSLGGEHLKQGDAVKAAAHLAQAVALDPRYSAAWKLLGKAQLEAGDRHAARSAWQRGIEVAEDRGDKQAAKEMTVFLRRLERNDS
ncbi:MAG: tetratricopeptide repeat protein [Burkholderiales bacterium]